MFYVCSLRRLVGVGMVLVLMHSAARAHVALDAPNGGQQFAGGETIVIEWHPKVEHDPINWDLWYSTTTSEGPWIEIALDIPRGNAAVDSRHTFDWTVPNSDINTTWVRVRQDNPGQDEDYYDESDASFSITAAILTGDFSGNGVVGAEDLTVWETGFGTSAGAQHSDGDADADGDVDGADILVWQRNFTSSSSLAAAQAVPEPAAWLLVLCGCLLLRERP